LIWGLTDELIKVTHLFITQCLQNPNSINFNLELPNTKGSTSNIPILKTKKAELKQGEEKPSTKKQKANSDNVSIISVASLKNLLDKMMLSAKIKVIKIPYSRITRVYLSEEFNDLRF